MALRFVVPIAMFLAGIAACINTQPALTPGLNPTATPAPKCAGYEISTVVGVEESMFAFLVHGLIDGADQTLYFTGQKQEGDLNYYQQLDIVPGIYTLVLAPGNTVDDARKFVADGNKPFTFMFEVNC